MSPHVKLFIITMLGLLIKAVLLKWFIEKLTDGLDWLVQKYIAKYPQEITIWLHYKKKRKLQAHQYANPLICIDEDCKAITL